MSQQEFEHYLDLLARMVRLTPQQRDRIADELRTHLEDRLDDLEHQGHDRDTAVRLALEGFGDANVLATDLSDTVRRGTRNKQKRLAIRTTTATLVAAAVVTFVVMTLTPTNRSGQPTQAPAIAEAPVAKDRDQVSLETRILLVRPEDAERFKQAGRPTKTKLPGLADAVVLGHRNPIEDLLDAPGFQAITLPRVTNYMGHLGFSMNAIATTDTIDGNDETTGTTTTHRGLMLGWLALRSPDDPTLRVSMDLQTVWSEPVDAGPYPSFGSAYGELVPARPIGEGWNPGVTGLRFQFSLEPDTILALKLPLHEADLFSPFLQPTDPVAPPNRDVWMLVQATVISPREEEDLMFPGLNEDPVSSSTGPKPTTPTSE